MGLILLIGLDLRNFAIVTMSLRINDSTLSELFVATVT